MKYINFVVRPVGVKFRLSRSGYFMSGDLGWGRFCRSIKSRWKANTGFYCGQKEYIIRKECSEWIFITLGISTSFPSLSWRMENQSAKWWRVIELFLACFMTEWKSNLVLTMIWCWSSLPTLNITIRAGHEWSRGELNFNIIEAWATWSHYIF